MVRKKVYYAEYSTLVVVAPGNSVWLSQKNNIYRQIDSLVSESNISYEFQS